MLEKIDNIDPVFLERGLAAGCLVASTALSVAPELSLLKVGVDNFAWPFFIGVLLKWIEQKTAGTVLHGIVPQLDNLKFKLYFMLWLSGSAGAIFIGRLNDPAHLICEMIGVITAFRVNEVLKLDQ